MAKKRSRTCAKKRSHCKKGGGLTMVLRSKSKPVLAKLAKLTKKQRRAKPVAKRTQKALVNAALKANKKKTLARKLHISLA